MEANEHSHILNGIEEILTNQKFIFERLSKLENDERGTAKNAIGDKAFFYGDKALLSKLNMDVEDNRKDLYFVEDELKRHYKDAHISQGQVKKWIHEKIEEATNGKD
jgi:hypothetical protein